MPTVRCHTERHRGGHRKSTPEAQGYAGARRTEIEAISRETFDMFITPMEVLWPLKYGGATT